MGIDKEEVDKFVLKNKSSLPCFYHFIEYFTGVKSARVNTKFVWECKFYNNKSHTKKNKFYKPI